jgi:hypothetical protein
MNVSSYDDMMMCKAFSRQILCGFGVGGVLSKWGMRLKFCLRALLGLVSVKFL